MMTTASTGDWGQPKRSRTVSESSTVSGASLDLDDVLSDHDAFDFDINAAALDPTCSHECDRAWAGECESIKVESSSSTLGAGLDAGRAARLERAHSEFGAPGILSPAELDAAAHAEAARVGATADIPRAKAWELLTSTRWDTDAACAAAAAHRPSAGASVNPPHPAGGECGVCGEPFDARGDPTDTVPPCGHAVCGSCLAQHLEYQIGTVGGAAAGLVACPGCPEPLPFKVVALWLDTAPPGLVAAHAAALRAGVVAAHPAVEWCAGPDCPNAIALAPPAPDDPVAVPVTVRCHCGHEVCGGCGAAPHEPASCVMMAQWETLVAPIRSAIDAHRARTEALEAAEQARTVAKGPVRQPCPVCGVLVEKISGCE